MINENTIQIEQNNPAFLTPHSEFSNIRVAICGNLPTAYDFLLRQGVVQIDQYMDATELIEESDYHLILIYAPHAEGLLNTAYSRNSVLDEDEISIPIRLLNEPCCHSALLELKSMIRRIVRDLQTEETEDVMNE